MNMHLSKFDKLRDSFKKKKQICFAKFDPRSGFLSISLVQNSNLVFVEKISPQCFILFQGSQKEKELVKGKEFVVGCWVTGIRDIVINSNFKFFQTSNHTVGELFDRIIEKEAKIFGEGNQFLKLVNNKEIRQLRIEVSLK